LRKTPATATIFSVHGGSWRGTVKLRRGARASLRHSSCHSTKDDMVPDLQPGSTITRTEGDVVRMCDQVQVTTMRFSRPGDIIGAEGGEADPQDATKWSCPD